MQQLEYSPVIRVKFCGADSTCPRILEKFQPESVSLRWEACGGWCAHGVNGPKRRMPGLSHPWPFSLVS